MGRGLARPPPCTANSGGRSRGSGGGRDSHAAPPPPPRVMGNSEYPRAGEGAFVHGHRGAASWLHPALRRGTGYVQGGHCGTPSRGFPAPCMAVRGNGTDTALGTRRLLALPCGTVSHWPSAAPWHTTTARPAARNRVALVFGGTLAHDDRSHCRVEPLQ